MAIDATNAALERNLDSLQLSVGLQWGLRVRFYALMVGTILGLVLGIYVEYGHQSLPFQLPSVSQLVNFAILAVLGLISGFLASLLYDLLSKLLGSRYNDV
jgi:H+/Cl- antiporter ClcA